MVGSNIAGGYPKHRRRAVVAAVSILLCIPGKVIETGPSKLSEIGRTVKPATFDPIFLQLTPLLRVTIVMRKGFPYPFDSRYVGS